MAEVEIGKVVHYFSKAGVAAIQVTQDVLRVGDTIHVKGHTSDFTQKIDSMQLDNQPVTEAVVGQAVGAHHAAVVAQEGRDVGFVHVEVHGPAGLEARL